MEEIQSRQNWKKFGKSVAIAKMGTYRSVGKLIRFAKCCRNRNRKRSVGLDLKLSLVVQSMSCHDVIFFNVWVT